MDKSITIRTIYTIVFCALFGSLFGQNAKPRGLTENSIPVPTSITIPAISYEAVEKRDKANFWNDRVSVPASVDHDLTNSGDWHTLANGDRIWRLQVNCKNSKGLAFMFRHVSIPAGASLHFYSLDGKHIVKSFESIDINSQGNLVAGPIVGTSAIIEYYEPQHLKGQGQFDLFNVQRLYKDFLPSAPSSDPQRAFGDAWNCQVNVECIDTDYFDDAKRSVVRILMTMEEGMIYCSGGLINNTAQDMTPYILSAFHCSSDLTPMYDFFRFDFNFASPFCTNPTQEPPYNSLVGCTSVAGNADSDFELLRLFQSIPTSFNAYFAGWNRTLDYRPDTTTLIHHPSGDIRKISQEFSQILIFNSTIEWDNGLVTTPRSHYRGFLDLGAFQGGSSGAPLFDDNGHIVAQLHGGDAECDNPKAFSGIFAKSWTGGGSPITRLREWLDPINAGNLVQQGFDPSNSNSSLGSISGKVKDANGGPMSNTIVYLNSDGVYPRSAATILDSTFTDSDGLFSFTQLDMGVDYYVSAANDKCERDGIAVSDITRVINHLLYQQRFTSPYQYIVADVNNDGQVSVNDILFVRFLLLNNIQRFPAQDSYIIMRGDMVFEEDNPLTSHWEQEGLIFKVNNLSGPALVPDFVAYKIGDSTLSSSGCDD